MGSEVDRAVPDTAPVPGSGSAAAPAPARPLGRRVRALAARSMHPFAHGPANQTPLEALVAAHRAAHPKADMRLLHQAYEVAEREHRGQQRTSGEPFITHPV
ncbi:MAG TPA: GTP pyrophosphokinase, partial [Actinomycetota bacterium]